MILAVDSDSITLCEGNFNSSIHWGRTMTPEELEEDFIYRETCYGLSEPKPLQQADGASNLQRSRAAGYLIYAPLRSVLAMHHWHTGTWLIASRE